MDFRKAIWLSTLSSYAKIGLPKVIEHMKFMDLDEVYLIVSESIGTLYPSNVRPMVPQLRGKDIINPFIKELHKVDIKVHAWIVTLLFNNEEFIKKHKDWYVVNKLGISCIDKPPYIESYKWLCPSREEVVNHVVDLFSEVVEKYDVDGVHFDYIRYPDILLPRGIRKRYENVPLEDIVKPEFDYCYCSTCCSKFESEFGINPRNLKYFEYYYGVWFKWRTDKVTNLVKQVYEKVKRYDSSIEVSAAVFPTPKIAYEYVLQNWTIWGLDHYNPMIYHRYYEKTYKWIGEAVRESVLRGLKILAGIHLYHIGSKRELLESVRDALLNGAVGICIFVYPPPSMEYIKWVSEVFKEVEKSL